MCVLVRLNVYTSVKRAENTDIGCKTFCARENPLERNSLQNTISTIKQRNADRWGYKNEIQNGDYSCPVIPHRKNSRSTSTCATISVIQLIKKGFVCL
jgi:hypothetical protein